jgi:hypothetical protein
MSRRRTIYFQIDDNQVESDYGNWVLLLYYAKQMSKSEFWLLFEFSVSAYSFYSYWKKDESKLSILNEESDDVLFDAQKISQAILFLDRLVNKLKDEHLELIEKFGGEERFITLLNEDADDSFPIIEEGRNWFYDNEQSVLKLIELRDNIFKCSLEKGKPHSVFVM